jgi:uncharacterized protein with beta-barrel porin domain
VDNAVVNDGVIAGAAGGAVLLSGAGSVLINRGTVEAAGGAAVRFESGASGEVVNELNGLIGGPGGIGVQGGAGRDLVTNLGRILGSGDTALDLGAGADELTITNTSNIQGLARGGDGIDTLFLGGKIGGTFNLGQVKDAFDSFERFRKASAAAWTLAGAGTLDLTVDQGTLIVAGDLLGTIDTNPEARDAFLSVNQTGSLWREDAAPSVELKGNALLVNQGLVGGAGVGVAASGDGNRIINDSDIVGGTGAALSVNGNNNTATNQAFIYGNAEGVRLEGSNNLLSNFGNIVVDRDAVLLNGDGARLVNDGLVQSTAATGTAVVLAGTGETATNRGLISAEGTGVRIDSPAGGGASVTNEAGAVIQSLFGTAIQGGAGDEVILNDGTIFSGAGRAIALAGGNDLVRLSTSSRLGGTVDGGAGVDTMILAGSGAVGADLSTFTAFEALRKQDGGLWVLSGAANMDWTLEGGQLIVDGSLAGAGVVQAGTLLGGNGTVGGFVNAGTVAPGASIGTLRVAGNFEHAGSATLEIEGAVTGASDRLAVDGRAVINGGALELLNEERAYGVATEHTFLTAGGGVTGTFGAVTSNLAHLDPVLDYDGGQVVVTLIRNDVSFAAMADTANLRALGSSLDANKKSMARGEFKELMDEFLVIDAAGQQAGLFSLSGELHASTGRTLLRSGERFFSAATGQQLSAQRKAADRRTVWSDVVRFSGAVDADGNAGRAQYRSIGFTTGADVMVSDHTRLGVSVGFAPTGRTTLDRFGGGEARVRSYHPALYVEHSTGRWGIAAGAGYGRHDVNTTRGIRVGSLARSARADYVAHQYSGLLSGELSVARMSSVGLAGFGELRYSTLTRNAFEESGAGSAALSVAGAQTESLRTVLGVRATWEPSVWGMRVKPEFRAGWARESLDLRGELTSALAGTIELAGHARSTVVGVTEGRHSAVLSTGLSTSLVEHGHAFVSYDGLVNATGAEHGFSAGVKFGW